VAASMTHLAVSSSIRPVRKRIEGTIRSTSGGIGGHHESAGQSRQRVADARAAQERNSRPS
jgi:hypothetical protein